MTERSRSGKTAWDKEKTRELFRRYKETGDPDAREQLVMSHMNLVRFLANKFKNRQRKYRNTAAVDTQTNLVGRGLAQH